MLARVRGSPQIRAEGTGGSSVVGRPSDVRMPDVIIQKLTSTEGFIAFDLDDAPAAGVVRSAPKILVDGASLLARSSTYRFASFERQVGGASVGINAAPDDRSAAVSAFVAEVEPLVSASRLLVDPAKGVDADELASLRAADPRPEAYFARHDELLGLGVAVAADTAVGGLAGRRVAIEGFDVSGPAVAVAVAERGGKVVAVSTAAGTAVSADGFDGEALAAGWAEHGPAIVAELVAAPGKPWDVFGVEADVLVVGSKTGVIDDSVADGLAAGAVVPSGPVPVTAKGLAVLRRRGVVVAPDFVTTAGPLFAGWPLDGASDPAAAAATAIDTSLLEVLGHEDGPLLGACHRAEAFLATWRDELPFGRPLA
jgi:glutamate dehydrogenase/leucine dehydrogenase